MSSLKFSENPKKHRRELAKLLSAIENNGDGADEIIKKSFSHKSSSKVIGITGAPGAGKSSLINFLIEELSNESYSIAVLAVDPSSPFTGGAILGDRTRMHTSSLYENLYIRSSSTRGHLGGLSVKTPEMLSVLSYYNFDFIIIETVGVGQAELDIMKCAHMTCVVLSPNMGDALQAIKAGLIEIADLFILNKADIPAINELEKDILFSLSLASKDAKKPNIIKTSALKKEGIIDLKKAIFSEYQNLKSSGDIEKRIKNGLDFLIELNLQDLLNKTFADPNLINIKNYIKSKVFSFELSPREASKQIFEGLINKISNK